MNISEIRQQYPQYSDLSDTELANALHDRFYPDVPIAEFYGKIGLATEDTKGFKAAAAAGFESLKGEAALTAGKVGLMDVAEAEAYQKEQEKKASARFTPTQDSWAESPWQKLKETAGGSAAYMALPAAAGLAALAAPAGIPAAAVGLGAAGLASGAQFVGTNLSRQMGTGKTLEETDLGAAAAAAVPQALLDTAALALMPGVGKLFGSVGAKLTTAEAKAIASQTFKQAATDYTAKTGMAMGREGATETVQQVLERLQAGLAIDDPEARKEYIESFIGGAALGGIFAPVGRYSERSGARTQVQDEQDTAERTAREESAQKEVDYKQSPQYITDIGTQFDALSAQFAQAKADLKKPGKEASAADWMAYKDRQKTLNELNEKLKDAYPEYSKVQKAWETQKETRFQDIETAAQEMPQQEQTLPYYQSPQDVLPGFEAAAPIETTTPMPEQDTQNEALELAQRQQVLAKIIEDHQQQESDAAAEGDVGALRALKKRRDVIQNEYAYISRSLELVGGYTDPLLEANKTNTALEKARADLKKLAGEGYDPEKADKLVSKIEALEAKVQELGPVQTGFDKDAFKPRTLGPNETRAGFAARVYKPGAAGIESQEQAYLDENAAAEEERIADAERQRRIAPEKLALQRIAGKPSPTVGETQVSSEVDQLVDLLNPKGTRPIARMVSGAGSDAAIDKVETLRGELAYAKVTNNKARAAEIKKELDDINVASVDGRMGDIEGGLAAKEAGVEGRQTPEVMQANQATRLTKAQSTAYDKLTEFLQQVRDGNQDVSDERKQTFRNAAERLKQTAIGTALNEIDMRRANAGMPELTLDEKVKAVGKLEQTLTELIERSVGIFQKPIVRQAQMRGTKLVLGAEESRQPLGRRVFNNYPAAAKAIRAHMRSDVETIANIPSAMPRSAPKVQKGERDLINKQYGGQYSERAVGAQFVAAYDRAKTDAEYRTLKDMESKFKNLSPEAQEIALEQARSVELNKALDIPPQLQQELDDVRTASASDTGQGELFTGDSERAVLRKTPTQFQRLLDSGKLDELKAKIVKTQKAAVVAAAEAVKVEKALAEETAKVEAFQKKVAAYEAKPEKAKAEASLARLTKGDSRTMQAVKIADAVKRQRWAVRTSIGNKLSLLKTKHVALLNHAEDLQAIFDLQQELVVARPYSKKALIDFERVEKDLRMAEQSAEGIGKRISAASAVRDGLLEAQDKDVIGNAIIREGDKADRKIERAREAVRTAVDKEGATKRALEATLPAPAPEIKSADQTVEEALTATGAVLGDRTIVYRNTSDPFVQAAVKQKRGAIGKAEAEHEAARLSGDKKAMALAAAKVESAYNAVYKVLNDAPLVKVDPSERARIEAQDAFDGAQQAATDAMVSAFREVAGASVFKLPPRRMGPVERTKTGFTKQAPKELNTIEEIGLNKIVGETPLEKLAKTRARFAEINSQLNYIKEHPSATKEGKAKQKAAKANLIAEKSVLTKDMTALVGEQRKVTTEVKLDRKEVRAEGKRALRAQAAQAGERPLLEDDTTPSTIDTKRKTNDLNAEATALAEDGQILALTDYIAANGATPRLKDMAARLRPLIMRTKLVVQDEVRHKGEKVAGIYAPAENTIYLARNHLSEEDFIHEAYHAATDRVLLEKDLANLTPSQRTARAALEGMWAALKDNPAFEGVHATSSVREFVAEVRTNELLRKKMEATGKPLTLWQRFKNAIKRLLKLDDVSQADSYIEEILQPSNKIIAPTTASQATPSLLRSKAEKPSDASLGEALAVARSLTAKKRTLWDDIRANGTGLSFATQFLDRFAGLEKISKLMEPLKGTQMMYFLRMYDQRMNFVSQAVANGALSYTEKTRKDGSVEYIVESKRGASLAGVAKILKDARTITGSGDNTSQLFTMYLAALRAERVGFSKLHFGNDITEAQLREAKNTIDSNPALKKVFDSARTEYNAYNEGLVNFARDSGVFSDKEAALLTGSKDYIPFYRERNGVVELLIGGENPVKIGSIKDQPHLKDLVGGDTAILDFLTSSVQNTNMLIDMALRNKATKSAAYELNSIGMAKIVTNPTSGNDVVKFKEHGIDKYAILDTQSSGIPADIIVKGMEGIPVQMTGIMRMLQIPSTFLRKAITASPMYAARQLFRDSVAAPMLSGANMLPVIDAVRQIGSATKGTLESRGITGGQIFTGGQADLKDILRRVTDGKSSWLELLNKAETVAMEADAVTRRAQYNSYIKQGLSEMEATLLALESMNFNKRGASPSVHMANALIPFFNAQVQGLNVLYKALTGKMPFNDRLKIQEKLLTRGALMMATSLAYAAAMQDDEAYKNATPEQKYGNWFVRIFGMDEPLRIPVPFEVGYIFKALPEALYNTMVNEHGKEEAVEAFKQIMLQTIPGGSSYGIPQAMKPAIEAGLGKSFYTGRDLMSKREQMLLPEAQFREDTSELARSVGRNFGYSPIVFESLIRGYTGTMGMMLVQAVSAPFQSSDSPEKAVKRWSKVPVIGQAFQPNDAGYIINSVYDNMLELKSVKASVDDYIKRGEIAKAKELISERGDEYALASVADTFVKEMQNFTKAETATRASSLSPQEKQAQLEKIRKIKIQYAAMYREAFDKTKRQ